ncbi:MAG: AMP-binding protein [Paramuribaculum sp.]|nr:AMP-binding protein [Paramuribaculum sp.]
MELPRIVGSTPELEAFLDEWFSPSPTIEAHTSGSTGDPKLIRLLKEDMRISARSTCRSFGLNRESVMALPLSVGYIAGKMMVVRAIESGATLFVESPSSLPLVTLPADTIVDLVAVVPAQLPGLLGDGLKRVKVKAMIVGGAPVDAAAEHLVLASGIEAFATYGMTETCSNVALRRFGTEFYRANPGFRFTSDSRGCLVVESEAMSFGSLTTNDIVELGDDSLSFRWIGRADNIINSGGIKVSPEEVERAIGDLIPQGRFYITSRPSLRWGEEVVGVVEQGCLPGADQLRAIAARLGKAAIPKAWIETESLPRTPNGKLLRRRFG